jgi:hypothetical protein
MELHPNLCVFDDQKAAIKWIKSNAAILAIHAMSVAVVANATEKTPNGCSIIFK